MGLSAIVFHHLSLTAKHEKQIGDGIKMKTIFVFLLAMVMSISGFWLNTGNSHANAKVGKRIQNTAHRAKDFSKVKILHGDEESTPCEGAMLQCISARYPSIVENPEAIMQIIAECCRENEEICLSEPEVCESLSSFSFPLI